jgi:hypothetical protein
MLSNLPAGCAVSFPLWWVLIWDRLERRKDWDSSTYIAYPRAFQIRHTHSTLRASLTIAKILAVSGLFSIADPLLAANWAGKNYVNFFPCEVRVPENKCMCRMSNHPGPGTIQTPPHIQVTGGLKYFENRESSLFNLLHVAAPTPPLWPLPPQQ